MKRIGIDVLFMTLQLLDFTIRNPGRPLMGGEIAFTLLVSAALAILCFVLLLRFAAINRPWSLLIDAVLMAILTIGVSDIIFVSRNPNDNFYTVVPLSLLLSFPVALLINVMSLALVLTVTKLHSRGRS